MAEYDPAGEFTGTCHSGHELVVDGGPNGGDTYSRVSCGTVSVDHSDKHPSVELFSGDIIFVNCGEGLTTVDEVRGEVHRCWLPGGRPELFQDRLRQSTQRQPCHHHWVVGLLRRLSDLAVPRGLHVREDWRGGG